MSDWEGGALFQHDYLFSVPTWAYYSHVQIPFEIEVEEIQMDEDASANAFDFLECESQELH